MCLNFPAHGSEPCPCPPCPAPLHVQPRLLSHLAVSAPPTRLTPELPVPSARASQQRQNILGKAPRGHCKACPGPGGRWAGGRTDGRESGGAPRCLRSPPCAAGKSGGDGKVLWSLPGPPSPSPSFPVRVGGAPGGLAPAPAVPGAPRRERPRGCGRAGASSTGGHGRQRGREFRYLPPSRGRLTGDVLGAGLRGWRRGTGRPGPRGAHRQQPQPARGRTGAVLPSLLPR